MKTNSKPNNTRARRHAIALMLVFALLAACSGAAAQDDDETTTTQADSTTTTEAETPPTIEVVQPNGERQILPLVSEDDGVTDIGYEAMEDPRTPSVYEDAKAEGPMENWCDVPDLMGDKQYYVDGINSRSQYTGFGWSDIEKWCDDTTEQTGSPNGFEQRVIVVFNDPDVSDEDAREGQREVVGDDAFNIHVVHVDECIANTSGFGSNQMETVGDCRQMTRVALVPLVYDDEGNIIGIEASVESGIFVDCFNLWWLFDEPPLTTSATMTSIIPDSSTTTPTTVPTTPTTVPHTTTTGCNKDFWWCTAPAITDETVLSTPPPNPAPTVAPVPPPTTGSTLPPIPTTQWVPPSTTIDDSCEGATCYVPEPTTTSSAPAPQVTSSPTETVATP